MVELQEPCLAATAVGTDEGALAGIAFPDEATDVRGHPPRVGDAGDGGPGDVRLRESPALKLTDECRQSSFDNRRRIAGRQSMTQQILSSSELLVRFPTDRDLDRTVPAREA